MSNIILGIETATKICSVAISKGTELLALKEEGGEYSHAEKLNGFIEECLLQAKLTIKDIDAIAVSKGPGSYTGLRIGVSTAKGLCYSLDKPLIAVDTLQAMALNISKSNTQDGLYCAMIDARRMEVYTAIYDANNKIITDITAEIIDENSFADALLQKKVTFFGDGAAKCAATFSQQPNAIFSEKGLPSAQYINELAAVKYSNEAFEDVAYFEPYYLKDFIATTAKKLL